MNPFGGLAWTNRFAGLGPDFFTELSAQCLPDPHWVAQSPDCAQLLGLPADWAASPEALAAFSADFTITFRRLSRALTNPEPLRDMFIDREALDAWLARWRARVMPGAEARMLAVNPAVVLRSHLAEGAIRAAQRDDFTEIERLLKVLSRPFDEPAVPSDAALPPDWAQHLEVSSSS